VNSRYTKRGVITALLSYVLFLTLSGCGALIPQVARATVARAEQPIRSPFQPYRVVHLCIDTPPLFSAHYFREAASAVADAVDASVMPNQGGLTVFVSLIEHDSLQTNVVSISVPALPADPQQPALQALPDPAKYQNPYDLADAGDKVKKANAQLIAAWQAHLKSNHQQLATIRAAVKQETNKLRVLPAPFDSTGADVWGCLQNASQHFQGVTGEKFLLIASPLINNTLLQASNNIFLSGESVRVVWHTCQVAAACQANDTNWKHMFLQYGAKDVRFYDPVQSEVEKQTF